MKRRELASRVQVPGKFNWTGSSYWILIALGTDALLEMYTEITLLVADLRVDKVNVVTEEN